MTLKSNISIDFVSPTQPVNLATPHQIVHMPYISDIDIADVLSYRSLGIMSATGTGKTALSKHYIEALEGRLDRVLVITHRQSLSKQLGNRLGLSCYLDFDDNEELADQKQLVICLNSLHRLLLDGGMPKYDVIIIDEPQLCLNHLSSNTFKNSGAVNAYSLLRHLLETTERLLTLDAHLSQTVVDIFNTMRATPMTVIQNTYRKKQADAYLYSDIGKALSTAILKSKQKLKPLVVACETLALSESVYDELAMEYGQANVLLVNGKTSGDPEQRLFLDDPNAGIQEYKAVIHTSTIDSGVSIDDVKAVVCGLFDNSVPFVASHMNQMIARVRNPIEIHLGVITKHRDPVSTDPQELYKSYYAKAQRNHAYMERKNGQFVLSFDHQQLLVLMSQLQGDQNIQLNAYFEYIQAYLEFDGFNVISRSGKNAKINNQLIEHKEKRDEENENLRIDEETLPLSKDDYMELADNPTYTMTERDHAGYAKGRVLEMLGLDNADYTRQIDKDLNKSKQRSQLYRFIDLYIPDRDLNEYDEHDDSLVTKRLYRTSHKKLFEDIIWRLFYVRRVQDVRDIDIYQDELELRIEDIIQSHASDLYLIGIDVTAYKTSSRLANRILSCIGLKLVSERRRINSETRTRCYQIDAEALERWLQYKTWYLSKNSKKQS